MKKNKIVLSIITPVYNEKKTVIELLKKVYFLKSDLFEKEMIIVESNSNDGSRELVKKFVKEFPDVKLVLEKNPSGKGLAVRKGFAEATGDIILIQDADLEYDVHDYDRLVKPIIDGKTKFVLGSRHLREDQSFKWWIRKFNKNDRLLAYVMNTASHLMDAFFNMLYGTHLTDPHTMFKVFHKDLLKQVHFEGNYFELDVEIVSKFMRLGYFPVEVPVKYNSRSPSEGKKVKLTRDGYRMIKSILKYRFIDGKYL